MAMRRFMGNAPALRKGSPRQLKKKPGVCCALEAPDAGTPGCECPPAMACGHRLLLDFAPRGTRIRRGRMVATLKSANSNPAPLPGFASLARLETPGSRSVAARSAASRALAGGDRGKQTWMFCARVTAGRAWMACAA